MMPVIYYMKKTYEYNISKLEYLGKPIFQIENLS